MRRTLYFPEVRPSTCLQARRSSAAVPTRSELLAMVLSAPLLNLDEISALGNVFGDAIPG